MVGLDESDEDDEDEDAEGDSDEEDATGGTGDTDTECVSEIRRKSCALFEREEDDRLREESKSG